MLSCIPVAYSLCTCTLLSARLRFSGRQFRLFTHFFHASEHPTRHFDSALPHHLTSDLLRNEKSGLREETAAARKTSCRDLSSLQYPCSRYISPKGCPQTTEHRRDPPPLSQYHCKTSLALPISPQPRVTGRTVNQMDRLPATCIREVCSVGPCLAPITHGLLEPRRPGHKVLVGPDRDRREDRRCRSPR